jgi:hypothetical protein
MERYALPSKTFTFLAAGKPIAGLLQPGNDVSAMIESDGVGWNASTPQELAALVRRLCADRSEVANAGAKALDLYRRRFERERGVAAYRQLFDSMLESRSTSRTQ